MEGTREEGVEGYLLIDKRASSRGPFFQWANWHMHCIRFKSDFEFALNVIETFLFSTT